MESSISRKFSNLIAAKLDINKLITEGVDIPDSNLISNKKTKFSIEKPTPDKIIGKLLVKEVSKALESSDGYNSVEELIASQLRSVAELHEKDQCYIGQMNKVAEFIEIALYERVVSLQVVISTVNKEIFSLPLSFLWRLSKLEILTLEQVIYRFGSHNNGSKMLLKDVFKLIFKLIKDNQAEEILKDVFIILIRIICDLEDLESKYESTKNMSKSILNEIIEQILQRLDSKKEPETVENFINIYECLSEYSTLYKNYLEQYASQQLIHILSFEAKLSLNIVIQKQSQWRSTNCNKVLSSLFLAIVKLIGCDGSFSTLDMVVRRMEVNWNYIFSFLGTLLLAFPEASTKLKETVGNYIQIGCSSQDIELLILGFLYARLASLEGRHVFPAYPQWFASVFGAETTSPANNKQSFIFLIKFLTNLVPYDSPEILRAQINQSIYIPRGCLVEYREYQGIVKCRLDDLKENVSAGLQSKDIESDKAISDVESAVLHYEETRKLSSFILEASIFQRNYYLNQFLPLLLKPRRLPDNPDSKMSLINELHTLGKIPNKLYQTYKTQCETFVDSALDFKPDEFKKISYLHQEEIERCLSEIVTLMRHSKSIEEINDKSDHKWMAVLSKLTEFLEKATSEANEKLKDKLSSVVVLTELEFKGDAIHYKITYFDILLIIVKKYGYLNRYNKQKNKTKTYKKIIFNIIFLWMTQNGFHSGGR